MKHIKSREIFLNESVKSTDWTLKYKPAVLNALSQINAPMEWKKNILKAEKIAYTAWGAVNIWKINPEKAYEKWGYKWNDLMKEIGNPECQEYSEKSPNLPYWLEYTKLRGLSTSFNFSDCLA